MKSYSKICLTSIHLRFEFYSMKSTPIIHPFTRRNFILFTDEEVVMKYVWLPSIWGLKSMVWNFIPDSSTIYSTIYIRYFIFFLLKQLKSIPHQSHSVCQPCPCFWRNETAKPGLPWGVVWTHAAAPVVCVSCTFSMLDNLYCHVFVIRFWRCMGYILRYTWQTMSKIMGEHACMVWIARLTVSWSGNWLGEFTQGFMFCLVPVTDAGYFLYSEQVPFVQTLRILECDSLQFARGWRWSMRMGQELR